MYPNISNYTYPYTMMSSLIKLYPNIHSYTLNMTFTSYIYYKCLDTIASKYRKYHDIQLDTIVFKHIYVAYMIL